MIWNVVFAQQTIGSQGAYTETILHDFGARGDGLEPSGDLLLGSAGVLIGTTSGGGYPNGDGTVFELSPPVAPSTDRTETLVYSFTSRKIPFGGPNPGVVADASGTLYDTTEGDGVSNLGAVFELLPPARLGSPWTAQVIHTFTDSEAALSRPPQLLSTHTAICSAQQCVAVYRSTGRATAAAASLLC